MDDLESRAKSHKTGAQSIDIPHLLNTEPFLYVHLSRFRLLVD